MRSPSAGRGKIGSKNSLLSIPPASAAAVPIFPGFQNSFGATSSAHPKRNRALLSTSPTAGRKQKSDIFDNKGRSGTGMDIQEEEETLPALLIEREIELVPGEMDMDSEEEREGEMEGEERRENIDWKGDVSSSPFTSD